MKYDADMRGEFAEVFKQARDIVLSYSEIKELKNAKQTSYSDENGVIVMMRSRDDHFVLSFGKGDKLQGRFPMLQGSGKIVRHLYLKSVDDLDEKVLREMIEESIVLGMEAAEMKRLRRRKS